jgi:SNF2 family DNA or RNA helicase
MGEIIINESFSEENFSLFEKLQNKEFDSLELFDLRVEADKISEGKKITKLTSYESIKKNLTYKLPYQINGALKILQEFNCSALLADEVGLGKTITAGLILKEGIIRGFLKKILILTPPSLVDQWVVELKEKFELNFKIVENEIDIKNTFFAIASLDRVKGLNKNTGDFKYKEIHNISWDLVLVDEAHKLKEKNTVRWKFVDKIQKKRFLLLTATPFQNNLLELYNLLNLLKKGHLGTVKEFREQFLNKGNKRYPLNPKELKFKLDEVMVRRKRSETGIKYKKRLPKIIVVEQTSGEKEIYKKICTFLKEEYFSSSGEKINGRLIIFALLPKMTSSSKSAIESLKKIIDNEKYHEKTKAIAYEILKEYKFLKKDSKMEKLIEIVENIVKKESSSKILIYTKHPTTLNYMVERLKPMGFTITEFAGGLNREEKTKKIEEFKKTTQILISTDTGAEGLNLQFCHTLINYDLPWNPMSVEQRIGRLDRIGQEHDINIYSLAIKDTMEEHIIDLIINKMCCVGLVIGELPIILFNLGLDGNGKAGTNKIEERLLNSFIDSKNNLEFFAKDVDEISRIIKEGTEKYNDSKESTSELLDEEMN